MGAWSPHLLDVREPWAEEGLVAARQAGDPAGVAVILLVMALDALERADLPGWLRLSEEASRLADRERLPYVSISLQWLRMTLAGLRGDRAEVAREYAAMSETAPQVAIPMKDAQAPAAELLSRIWDREALLGKVDELLAAFRDMFGTATVTHVMLARAGRVEEVRPLLARSPMPAETDLYWSTINDWVFESEAAVLAEDRALAMLALERLRPFAGRMSVAGASAVSGPVDGYLALLEAFVGDPAAASRSADAALATAQQWGFTAYVAWLRAWRDTPGHLNPASRLARMVAEQPCPSSHVAVGPDAVPYGGLSRTMRASSTSCRRLTRGASSPLRAPPSSGRGPATGPGARGRGGDGWWAGSGRWSGSCETWLFVPLCG